MVWNSIDDVREHGEELASQALELLSYDTRNPPGETRELADYVRNYFEDLGLETEVFASDPEKPNVLAWFDGDGDYTLAYNGHLDTVPFDAGEWSHDPLGERVEDRVYGRGATDMKGPLASILLAAERFVEEGAPLDMVYVVVSDEETGGEHGAQALLEERGLEADGCVIGETTCVEDRHSVTVADRGSIWLTLEAQGRAAHGSRPVEGVNAVDRLYGAVEELRGRLERYTSSLPGDMEVIVEESVDYYGEEMGREAARELFMHPSVNLGVFRGGERVNVVPSHASAEVDVRLTAGIDAREVLGMVRDCVDGCSGVDIVDVSWSEGTYETLDSVLVGSVVDTVENVSGGRAFRRSATGGGDAKKFRGHGVPAVEFASGTDTAHEPDEYVGVENLVQNAWIYYRLPYLLSERV